MPRHGAYPAGIPLHATPPPAPPHYAARPAPGGVPRPVWQAPYAPGPATNASYPGLPVIPYQGTVWRDDLRREEKPRRPTEMEQGRWHVAGILLLLFGMVLSILLGSYLVLSCYGLF